MIVTGDNGVYLGSRGLAGKWSHFTESLSVPLVIAGPGVTRRGDVEDALALNVDLPATMLAAAGVAVPAHYQGRSLRPLLRGEAPADWRTDFFTEHRMVHDRIPKWAGVRGVRFVYAKYYEQALPFEFLHDRAADPIERRNLAGDPAFAADLARLRSRAAGLEAELSGAAD